MKILSLSHLLPAVLIAIAIGVLALGLLVVERRKVQGGRTFATLMMAIAIWCFAYALELVAPTIGGKLLWGRVAYLGVTVVPVAWLALAFRLARLDSWFRLSTFLVVSIIPVATLIVALVSPLTFLLWPGARLQQSGTLTLLRVDHGVVFWIFTLYADLLFVIGTVIMVRGFRRKSGVFRGQRLALMIGCAPPFLGTVLYVADIGPLRGLQTAPFLFVLSGAAFGWSLLRHGLLTIVPVAREHLVERMEDLVLVVDDGGRIVDINHSALAAVGLSEDEIVGRRAADVLSTQLAVVERFRDTRHARTEVAINLSGEQRWFDLRISPIGEAPSRPQSSSGVPRRPKRRTRSADAKIVRGAGVLGEATEDSPQHAPAAAVGRLFERLGLFQPGGQLVVLRDITERKRAEELLATSEERYRSVLENIEEGYFELDLKGTILSCNDVLAKIVGYPVEQMIGLNYREYTDVETANALKDVFGEIYVSKQTIRDRQHHIVAVDGTMSTVELSAMPHLDENGEVIGFRGLVHDVSQRMRAEEALRDAQERISRLLEGSSGSAEDLPQWVTATAREIAIGIGAQSIDVWEIAGANVQPLSELMDGAPSLDDVRALAALAARGLLETETGTIVPVTTTTGEICGIVRAEGRRATWGQTERRILFAFARQLGAALEMRRLREQLTDAEALRATRRREMKERGVALLQLCPRCRRCFPDSLTACPDDGVKFGQPRALPYLLADRYRFVSLLGTGGMGIVLAAVDEKLGREVAIKLLRPDHFNNSEVKRRFEREARTVAQVQHPSVIALFDAGELDDGTMYLVTERLIGADLASLIKRHQAGTKRQVASLVRQASSAIRSAHHVGVIHRDIKPGNIFLVNDPSLLRVKILDFGLAKSLAVDTKATQTGMIVGTPMYMAPEQIEGHAADARADVYSLGCVAYEALVGRRVARGEKLWEIMVAVLQETPEPPSHFMTLVSKEIDELFAAALAKDPAARPADIEKWGQRLGELLEGEPETNDRGWPQPVTGMVMGEAGPELNQSDILTAAW
ncbi:MAG TPA: histidine kinase N-terminal 7TM domain-containing protein [Thermoanaerobaculia bacterium]|nr:histidine kinase N-terminal 7TM domain-containing protein [Thermoanaerobaculia bacterium]